MKNIKATRRGRPPQSATRILRAGERVARIETDLHHCWVRMRELVGELTQAQAEYTSALQEGLTMPAGTVAHTETQQRAAWWLNKGADGRTNADLGLAFWRRMCGLSEEHS
jgi:hypothetical protein